MEHKTLCMTIEGARNLEKMAEVARMTCAELVEILVENTMLETGIFRPKDPGTMLLRNNQMLWESYEDILDRNKRSG